MEVTAKKVFKISDFSGIKKKSRIPGVMITQFVVEIPEGKSCPDFQRKPISLTIQQGKLGVFKAVVTGDPKPTVTWNRANGEITEGDKFNCKYDDTSGENTLEVSAWHLSVSPAEADTYKCFAVNEYGRAICTATLNVIEVGFSKEKYCYVFSGLHPLDFSKEVKPQPKDEGGIDERFWEIIMSADRKDYERICLEFGVKDLRLILKKLEQKKQEREEEQCKTSENPTKHVQVRGDGSASFEFEMELKDATSRIFLYKDGVMIPFFDDPGTKHSLKTVGKKLVFSINDLLPEDAGLYQVDVEDVNLFSTDFKIPNVNFVVKIQEVIAQEREDALFECVLSHPLPRIRWMGKNSPLEDGEKHSITVSEDKLIHSLLIRDCKQLDKGIYAAIAGIKSCSAWLVVQADAEASGGKKASRKTTSAGGAGVDLQKVAEEQRLWLLEERERMEASLKAKGEAELLEPNKASSTDGAGAAVANGYCKDGKERGGESQACVKDENAGSRIKFVSGLSDVNAILGGTAEIMCKVSSEDCEGAWFKDNQKLSANDDFQITKDGSTHKLIINNCKEEHSGKYRFEADGRKTEAVIYVKGLDTDLSVFSKPVVIKVGQNAVFQLPFHGQEPMKMQWFREGEELLEDHGVRIERGHAHSRLLLSRCSRKNAGEIKFRLRNDHGTTEVITQLVVLDRPTVPQGPAEVVDSSPTAIEFKWRPPKDEGGCPLVSYALERRQVGRNTWKKLGEVPAVAGYRDNDVEHGRKYCYRIRAVNAEGVSDVMETDDLQAGTLAFPGPPSPPKVVAASKDCITLSWAPPTFTAGSRVLGYSLEKRKKGSNLWSSVGDLITGKTHAVKDVVESMEYEFRVAAVNQSGVGEFSNPSEFVFARDPKMRPRFTDQKMKSFMVVRAGNSVRITVNFEAMPLPQVFWLKDNVPVAKRVNVSNCDSSSQLLIPSSERSDTGVYSITVKNLVGQETFSLEVRVTDDPKPPGPITLEEKVPGTVTVSWEPSPDEQRDDRLHYSVCALDSSRRTWSTAAERLFNNQLTVCNVMQGREYHFWVYAKNDMGTSAPSVSPTWGARRSPIKTSKRQTSNPDPRCAPSFMVPLKCHTAPKGYECYMSCAVKGNPKPRVTWYRNNVSLNTNTNYYISDICGVCSMLILRVTPKDVGEYTILAENALGRAECSTTLIVIDRLLPCVHTVR
uniref:Immunoglobulin-like and fibronectin type III domain-containing protein 1 n=1 Tax=Gadus morhua TaxID=8049 RepID=A0A8C4ZER8_GADMO